MRAPELHAAQYAIPRPRPPDTQRSQRIALTVAPLETSLGDVRDRALLLIGVAGTLRRSELVALNVENVSKDNDGVSFARSGPPSGRACPRREEMTTPPHISPERSRHGRRSTGPRKAVELLRALVHPANARALRPVTRSAQDPVRILVTAREEQVREIRR